MPAEPNCSECGTPLPGNAPGRRCPTCLLRLVLDETPVHGVEAVSKVGPVHAFGDYELWEEIARGGMGVVYRARQISLDRTVAVKMILAGQFASPAEVQRFHAEAAAAARLQHPNIVAIHEIGQHDGQPYFSMDLVEGRNLADFLRHTPLPGKQAARYLKAIAEAIHCAHQHGILHRDLKPSNVLIDLFDQPRITDFGLAKQMKGDSDLTLSGQVIGSPNFMPPEQAAGHRCQIGPPSDVYALGAILYYLLTARPPFLGETMTATLQQVVNDDPPSPRLLNARVPADLETICLKSLEKEPSKRYGTAQHLADELSRFLRDEPIRARPLSQAEKVWRWCRRKPASASAIALLLVVAIGSPIAALRINRERQQAQTQAVKSAQVAAFLKDMLQGVGPDVALGRDTTLLREILNKTVERVDKDLKDQPDVEAELRSAIGNTYHQLGEFEKAEAMHRQALRLRKAVYGEANTFVAASLCDLANALTERRVLAEAESTHREALAMRKELLGNEHVDVAVSLNGLAVVLSAIGKGREAEATFREALAIKRNRFGNEHREVADTLLGLGTVMYAAGKPAEAELVLREALALQRKLFGNDHLTLATCLGRLATALTMQHKLEEAELLHREALARRKKLLGNTHPKVANSIFSLATLLEDQGKLVEAETLFRELVAMLKERLGNTDPSVASSVHQLANVLEKQGKAAEAETLRRRSIGDLDAALKGAPGDTNLAAQLHFDRARAYVCLKDYEKAVPEFEKAIELDPNSPVARNTLAWYYANGPINICSPEKALALALKAVELTGRTNANYLNTLGVVYYRLGQLTNALETLEAGLKEGGTATTAYDFLFLAMSCQRLADPSQAQDYFRKATNWLASQSSLRSNQKAELAAYRAEAEQLLAKQSTK